MQNQTGTIRNSSGREVPFKATGADLSHALSAREGLCYDIFRDVFTGKQGWHTGKGISRRLSAGLVAVFFVAITLLGLLISADYGQPWDETSEQDILRMNLNQYAEALHLPQRYTGQGRLEWPQGGLIENSVERDHGESAYYPMLWLMGEDTLTGAQRMTLWHAYTWLWFMAGATALWLICRRLGLSRWLSCAVTLFLVLSPRMFAEGHYNNKDMVLLSLVLLTLWLALRLMEKPTFPRALLFSLAGALAANTKIIGLMIWGLCALFVLGRQIGGKRMSSRVWLVALVALVSFVGFYALLTPALWGDPLAYIQYVLGNTADFSRWKNSVLFRGAVFDTQNNSLPFYYLPYMILVTTPLWVLVFIITGQVLALIRLVKRRKTLLLDSVDMTLLLCTCLWLLPFLYAVVAGPTLYNGWRHMYFLYGPMLVLAAYGLHRAWNWLRGLGKPYLKRTGAVLLALCMTYTGTIMVLAHPNEYSYYNVLLINKDLPNYLELDYWNVSTLQTLRTLLHQLGSTAKVTIAGAETRTQQGLETAWHLLTPQQQQQMTVLSDGNPSAEYVISNTAHTMIWSWQPDDDLVAVVETQSYGQPLCIVYHRQQKQ